MKLQGKRGVLKMAENLCGKGFPLCGVSRDRTGDTRIFSPLLYRLSYRTILFSLFSLSDCKYNGFCETAKAFHNKITEPQL